MIKIIVGTNRKNAISGIIAKIYQQLLDQHGAKGEIVSLADLPEDFVFTALYEHNGKNKGFNNIHNQIKSGDKFVFIVPEYNGSFPGILKSFIDGMTYPNSFSSKNVPWLVFLQVSEGWHCTQPPYRYLQLPGYACTGQ